MTAGARFEVFFAGRLVLSFRTGPGVLLSTASRPPGFSAPEHPFVSAQAHDAGHEQQLADLLTRARSVEEFSDLLTQAGYEVRTAAGEAREGAGEVSR